MAAEEGWLSSAVDGGTLTIEAGGPWTLPSLERLDRAKEALLGGIESAAGHAQIVLDRLSALDTGGAWLLHSLARQLDRQGVEIELVGASERHAALLAEVSRVSSEPPAMPAEPNPFVRVVAELGRGTIGALDEGRHLLSFLGQIASALARIVVQPRRLRITPLAHHLEQTCVNALPIVGLISFLIGIVLAYQGADQLRRFGAEIYTINLLGVSILREIGIMLTAIVVAGRSGSAFTAQIGTMKVNEEVDAMRTLGLDPIDVLVLPRLLALVLALPLLAFFADIMGLLGGGLVCVLALGISPGQFLNQLDGAIGPGVFVAGLIKAPVFAFLIGMVGCYEGLKVSGSAESVGRLTTESVVVSIFLVIVFDALFSILFSYFGV